jgi:hypothetical protein
VTRRSGLQVPEPCYGLLDVSACPAGRSGLHSDMQSHATLEVRALSFGWHAPASNTITLCALPHEGWRYFPCRPFLQDTISAIRGQSSELKSRVSLICNLNRMTNLNSLYRSIVRNRPKSHNGILEGSGSPLLLGRI